MATQHSRDVSYLRPKCHRDGTVTYWSVYRQQWVRAASLSQEELASMECTDPRSCRRVERHLAAYSHQVTA